MMNGRDFAISMVSLLSLILIPSFFKNTDDQILSFNLALTLFFTIGINCLLSNPKLLKLTTVTGFSSIILTWFGQVHNLEIWVSLILQILYLVFFSIQLVHVLQVLFKSKITLNLIFGALNGYILIGFMGCCLMLILNEIQPNCYLYGGEHPLEFYDFIYFSFINLMTLGFGDILPNSNPAKAISIIQTLFGQMYLTVVVAMIVGSYLNERSR